MKIILLIGLLQIINSASASDNNIDCVLSTRIYPFKYIGATQTVEFRLLLQSNCEDYPIMLYFVLPYKNTYKLEKNSHPKKVIIEIKKRSYVFEFSDSVEKGYHRFFNIAYNKVKVSPSLGSEVINVLENNNILFVTADSDKFTKKEITSILMASNPVFCKLISEQTIMYCQM
jgi:hypothetical protein